jgi:hypothetical protein
MKLRFMQGTSWESTAITLQEKTCMPFVPSHVEALTQDGGFYIGAHINGGVMKRPVGYDAGQIAVDPITGKKRELLLSLETTPEQDNAFFVFLEGHLGQPYDWRAIIGFLLPVHEHIPNHAICSALIALALRSCNYFQWPLAAPAHLINPRDLLLVLSARMAVPM